MKMSANSVIVFVLICCIAQLGFAAKVVVDGETKWKNPVAQIGDSIIFSHRDHLKLYIFRDDEAFVECDFTQAFLLNKPNSASYTWNPSRPGVFYFSFSNGTNSSCRNGQKWAIKVVSKVRTATAPVASPKLSPAPIPGGIISSSPGYKFPSLPPEGANSPEGIPGLVSQKGGGIAVIDSNPAVPLPTDAVDTNPTKQPLHASQSKQQVGWPWKFHFIQSSSNFSRKFLNSSSLVPMQVVRGFLAAQLSLCVIAFLTL